MMRYMLIFALLVLAAFDVVAQKYPERKVIRGGNSLYEKGSYPEAEVRFRKALELKPDSYEAEYNLANSMYKQQRFDEAGAIMGKLAIDSIRTDHAADAYYNQGNALFEQRKLEEALEAYKNSLRRNPNDMQAKFNLAYTQKLLEKKDQNEDNKDNKNDQNKDNNEDQNNDQNKDNEDQDKNQDQKDQNKDQDGTKDKEDQSQGEQPQGGMSREEAEQMLDAVQGSEDNTKEKVDAQKAKTVGRSGKNW